ncbi:acyltransferase family protein [Microbacterium sp. 179-B 1A2 NHS]|uniref:acyltransferase family protein n=1 Tax=Microbacterium sp. 179-B 1A2 NHS TaxID=3142383 RepID=UPI0039A03F8D
MRPPQRLASLDGLRGVAAVVVLAHHALLTVPALAAGYYDRVTRDPLAWMLSYTPLHTFWAGREAVYLFFVLSGMVLVLPVLRKGREFLWLSYYPRRVLRLYLPVAAAVLFGFALSVLVTRYQAEGLGAWMNNRNVEYTLEGLFRDVLLVFGPSWVITPLWSLRWEVFFSLLLPVFVLLAATLRRMWWAKMAAVFALLIVGSLTGSSYLFLLPIFAIGALLIAEWERIGEAASRLDARPWRWPAFIGVASVLTTSTWLLAGAGDAAFARAIGWVPILGVTLFVIVAGYHAPSVRLLESRLAQWLGMISFALYLVHEPLIIAARFLTFPLSPLVGIAVSVPLAFLIAWVFAHFVEQPAHRLAKAAGMGFANLFTRSAARGPH